jgi:hypothetical protein
MDELNLALMKFRLRLGLAGYPLVIAQDGLCDALIKALVRVVRPRRRLEKWWEPCELATAVAGYLFEKCLFGKTYRFTWAYLMVSLKGFLSSGEKPKRGPVGHRLPDDIPAPDPEDDWDLEVAVLAQAARKIAAEFRAGLDAIHQELFDARKANGSSQGWRSRFARSHGVAPAWVTRHLNGLRTSLGQRLREEKFEVVDPDQFVEFLRWLEAPPKDEPDETPVAGAEAVLGYATQQASLEAVFAGRQEILDLMAAYGDGRPEEQILADLPGLPPEADQDTRCRVLEERLRQVHQAYVGIAQAFWREVKGRR